MFADIAAAGARPPPLHQALRLMADDDQVGVDLPGELADLLRTIIAPGPTREQDRREIVTHIHDIQNAILAQAAARAYPDRYRLLGSTLQPTVKAVGDV